MVERKRLINNELFEYQPFNYDRFVRCWSMVFQQNDKSLVRQKFVDGEMGSVVNILGFRVSNDGGRAKITGRNSEVAYVISDNFSICLEEDEGNLAVLAQCMDENRHEIIYRFFPKR